MPKQSNKMPLVIYHKGCYDGFCAAWIMRNMLKKSHEIEAEFVPMTYGDIPTNYNDRDVYILDFSFDTDTTIDIINKATLVRIFDHHSGCQEAMLALQKNYPNEIIFDISKSGARLVWDYYYSRRPPWLVQYTEDRDLWRHALPNSKEINAFIRSFPLDFDRWDELNMTPLANAANYGSHILRNDMNIVSSCAKHAIEISWEGHQVLAINATTLISEIGHELCQGRAFSVSWFDTVTNKVFSLRSAHDGVDVSAIARKYGGNGHTHSANFAWPTYPWLDRKISIPDKLHTNVSANADDHGWIKYHISDSSGCGFDSPVYVYAPWVKTEAEAEELIINEYEDWARGRHYVLEVHLNVPFSSIPDTKPPIKHYP